MNALDLRTALVAWQDNSTTTTSGDSGGGDSGGGGGSGGQSGEEQAAGIIAGLTAEDLIIMGAILGVGIVATIATSRGVRWLVAKQNAMIATLLGRIAGAIVFMIAFVYALNSIGIAVAPLLGALGVGGFAVAFALQDILKNLLAGVLIQLRQPFKIGDLVILEDYFGTVDEITLRTVDMTTVDGEKIIIPAATVLENPIENWEATSERRADIAIGIDYDADLASAAEGIKQAVAEVDEVLESPAPKVVASEFGDSAITLRILVWHRTDVHFLDFKHAVIVAAKRWCDDNGVGIPFPIREMQLRGIGDYEKVFANGHRDGSSNGDGGEKASESADDGGKVRETTPSVDKREQNYDPDDADGDGGGDGGGGGE